MQKQPSRGVLKKRCSENMQQIYRRTPMPKCNLLLCNFIEVILRHGCFPVNLLHNFRTPFLKNTSGWLLLQIVILKVLFINSLKQELVYTNSKWKIVKFCWSFWSVNYLKNRADYKTLRKSPVNLWN